MTTPTTHATTIMTQLELPFDFSTMHSWTNSAGGEAGLEFLVRLTPTGAKLCLRGPWPSEDGGLFPGQLPPRGILWQADVDLADPRRTVIAPAPERSTRFSFFTRLRPLMDCFTAPLAWAAEVGQQPELEVEGLLMAMRRSLVQVARHLEQVEAGLRPEPAEPSIAAAAVV
jgi:hypothetical protein